ncbi:hypothetical protein, partial [Microcoleus sp. herbarium12]|uniref:hypothetical protein n=1 Tax=Microcoleus sp. herbarium12 TaxID=3055437 RepID=UPI002FD2CEF8
MKEEGRGKKEEGRGKREEGRIIEINRVHLRRKKIYRSGAKHDLRKYEIITNNLYAVMLLQAS